MVGNNFIALAGMISLFASGFLGVVCGGVYCVAPNIYSFALGSSVREEILNIPAKTLWAIFFGFILLITGVFALGPGFTTVLGLPMYAVTAILFVGGFTSMSEHHSNPPPEIVTAPFLSLAIIHGYPKLEAVGSSAVALCLVILARCIIGTLMLASLTLTGDKSTPRLYGVIPEENWLFLSGAAAWVGMDHILGLFLCFVPLPFFAFVWWLVRNSKVPTRSGPQIDNGLLSYPDGRLNSLHGSIPWGAAIILALLIDLILRHFSNTEISYSSFFIFLSSKL